MPKISYGSRSGSEAQNSCYLHGTPGEQKIANLPKSRVEPAPPFHIAQWTVLGHGTFRQAGEKSQGTEPYSLVWPVVRYTLKLYTPWKQIRSCKHYGALSLEDTRTPQ